MHSNFVNQSASMRILLASRNPIPREGKFHLVVLAHSVTNDQSDANASALHRNPLLV
jgi:hypothetical protein